MPDTADLFLEQLEAEVREATEVEELGADHEIAQAYERLVQKALLRLDWCKSSADRVRSERRWVDAQNFWLSKQWDGIKSFGILGRSAEDKRLHANPVDNYVKAFTEGVVGDVTDRPVDIQVKPRGSEDEEIARKQNAILQYLWYVNRGDRKLEFAVRRAVLYGPLIAKVYWDPSWNGPPDNPFSGDVRIISVLPTNLFIDPRIKAVEEGVIQEAEFVIYGVRRSLSYIRDRYPEAGHRVSADTYAAYVTALTHDEESDYLVDDATVLLIEYWYRGEPMAPEFPRGDEPPPEPRKGWVHKAVIAGGVLLEHRTYVYPWFPFVLEWMYPSDESIYGYGDAYDMLLPQLVINKLNELSIEGAAIQTYGNWVTDEGNIRNKTMFQKYAGMGNSVLSVGDVNRIQRMLGGNVPQSLFVHYRQQLQAMETICGRHDVVQGRTPRNIQAASAIALLLQQAGGRVRQRSRAVASFVEQICRMALDLVAMHYTEERKIRVAGPEGTASWIPFSRRDIMKTVVSTNPLTGEQYTEEFVPEMDIIVTAGTETPTSKAYYSELAMKLYQMNVIDEIALLDTLQFPRWREVLARKNAPPPQSGGTTPPAGVVPEPPGAPASPPFAGGNHAPPVPPEQVAVQRAGAVEANPFLQIGGATGGSTPPEELAELLRLISVMQR